jgi:hypothetical protein
MKRTRSVIESELLSAKRARSEADDDVTRLERELGEEEEGTLAERLGPFWWSALKGEGLLGYTCEKEDGYAGNKREATLRIVHSTGTHTVFFYYLSGVWHAILVNGAVRCGDPGSITDFDEMERNWPTEREQPFWAHVTRRVSEPIRRVILGLWWKELSGNAPLIPS